MADRVDRVLLPDAPEVRLNDSVTLKLPVRDGVTDNDAMVPDFVADAVSPDTGPEWASNSAPHHQRSTC
ncbi:hypothetical protein [Candidatus Poriferisodalis sp.]|uniref:hypothetical protein n=1 Tax=Candidatus Poriferisodalis sp. TaxID=3101277 RepID=UPI003AF96DA8